jgi:hypothetical protein
MSRYLTEQEKANSAAKLVKEEEDRQKARDAAAEEAAAQRKYVTRNQRSEGRGQLTLEGGTIFCPPGVVLGPVPVLLDINRQEERQTYMCKRVDGRWVFQQGDELERKKMLKDPKAMALLDAELVNKTGNNIELTTSQLGFWTTPLNIKTRMATVAQYTGPIYGQVSELGVNTKGRRTGGGAGIGRGGRRTRKHRRGKRSMKSRRR